MRRPSTAFLTLLILAGVRADDPPAGQEPPARLLKKARPQEKDKPSPQQPGEAEKSDTKQPAAKPTDKPVPQEPAPQDDIQQKLKEAMERLAKNLRLADERLGKKDAGARTQQVQRDIVKDLEELMEQARQREEQQSQQQQSGASNAKGQRQQTRSNRRQQGSNPGQPMTAREAAQPKQSQEKVRTPVPRKEEMSKIADLYKDIWGHLPETLRQEMDQYSREQFMDKYNELLKQYYATIAEKGKRKGE